MPAASPDPSMGSGARLWSMLFLEVQSNPIAGPEVAKVCASPVSRLKTPSNAFAPWLSVE
jgi:hypothetical protein